MKILLRCATLLCLSLSISTSAIAESTPSPKVQPTLLGTWLYTQNKNKALIIFNRTEEINLLEEKIHGDYKYYQLPTADSLLYQIFYNDVLKIDPWPKYQIQGNLLKVTSPNSSEDRRRLEFATDGRSVSLIKEGDDTDKFTLQRVSDSTESPANTETQQALEGQFHGLKKLIAIQTAQTKYWQKQRRFATTIQKLSLQPFPEGDRLYQFKILQVNQRESTVAAIPKQPNLRGYVLRVDRRGLRKQPFWGILCGNDRPNDKLPPLPQSKKNQLACSTKTHNIELPYRISKSLFQLPKQ